MKTKIAIVIVITSITASVGVAKLNKNNNLRSKAVESALKVEKQPGEKLGGLVSENY